MAAKKDNVRKSILVDVSVLDELQLAVGLVTDLESALARERGGGTPLSSNEYIALDRRAKAWLREIPVKLNSG